MGTNELKGTKAITLISLVITIIVLLILAGVSLSLVVGETGIIARASKTKKVTETAELQEKIKIAAMSAQIEGLGTIKDVEVLKKELNDAIGTNYTIEDNGESWTVITNKKAFTIDKNGKAEETEYFDKEEWDKTAASEDCFYWASDDPNSEDYGTVIGYREKIENYTLLRYPSRCTKVELVGINGNKNVGAVYSDGVTVDNSRLFTNNILKIELPGTIKEISSEAFSDGVNSTTFKKLEEAFFSYGIGVIGDYAFRNRANLTNINIPNSVTSIGDGAFYGCAGLKEITIPNSVTSIGDMAFHNCSNLININVIENNINYSSEDGILYNKDKTELLKCPSCTQLTNIQIPSSVNTILHDAFRNCTGLRNIYIGSHITSIGSYAFEGGSDDLKIYTNASSTLEGWESYWNYQKERWDSNGVPWHVAYKVNYNTTLEEFNALVANESE